jgi:3-oxoacyl-[acyl-carrier protein] reductase
VSPGVIDTPLQNRVTPPEMLIVQATQIPLRRVGTAEECVGTFLYLCSERASGYVTGQIVEVNSGLAMP